MSDFDGEPELSSSERLLASCCCCELSSLLALLQDGYINIYECTREKKEKQSARKTILVSWVHVIVSE